MKVKADFVTNSSTTSFVAWGVMVGYDKLREHSLLLDLMYERYVNWSKQHDRDVISMDDWVKDLACEHELKQWLDAVLTNSKSELQTCRVPDDCNLYIGISPFNMRDDETFGNFKKRIEESLSKLGLPTNAGHIEEAWSDY